MEILNEDKFKINERRLLESHARVREYGVKGMLACILYQLRLIIDSETFQKISKDIKVSIKANLGKNPVLLPQKDAKTLRNSLEEYLREFEFK